VARYLVQRGGNHAPILPVYSMVDRRRSLHRKALDEQPGWGAIPMASTIEQMTVRRKPLGAFAPASPPAQAFGALWTMVERQVQQG
jgi:chromosome partitioning protein